MKTKRIAISKRVRFEVFKRDSFKCQYCGSSAPDVILQVDHIHPVAKGGTGDITNLVTACDVCNAGKSDKVLSDDAAAKKRKGQLDQLQERREQLEMMAEWQRGLVDLDEQATKECVRLWEEITAHFQLSPQGIGAIRKLVKQFGMAEVMHGIRQATAHYLAQGADGKTARESAELSLAKVGGVCVTERLQKDDPELHEIYKIRSMLMGRISSMRPWDVTNKLNALRRLGYTAPEIRARMEQVHKWYQFDDTVDQMTEEVQ